LLGSPLHAVSAAGAPRSSSRFRPFIGGRDDPKMLLCRAFGASAFADADQKR